MADPHSCMQARVTRASTGRPSSQRGQASAVNVKMLADPPSEDSKAAGTPGVAPQQEGSRSRRRMGRGEPMGPTPAGALPPLARCRHFVNLTNGLEALPVLQQLGLNYRCG